MSADRDVNRIVRSWLEEGVTSLPDRVLDTVLDQLPATPQRRAWWPVRRFGEMNTYAKVLIAVAAVAVLAVVGINALPKSGGVGAPGPIPSPATSAPVTPSPIASPAALPESGPVSAGTYSIIPPKDGFLSCPKPVTPPCSDTIGLLLTVPDGWTGGGEAISKGDMAPPGGAGLLFTRGAPLYVDPCAFESGTIPTGPTVDDFATALANHPELDVTTPVDVTLAGYSGKYVDLQVPADITGCTAYRPWEPGLFAQGASERWHLWIIDAGGQRVVVQSTDYAGTSEQDRTELQAIVDSIQIEP
jgi:hypothetical protein